MESAMHTETAKEISCRITRTLLMYVRENNGGKLDTFLQGLTLDETYLSDENNWVSHGFLQVLYERMIKLLGDQNTVYKMALSSERFQSLELLDRVARLLGNPKLIYSLAPKYNKLLKLNGSVFIKEIGDSWVVLEDRYHDSSQKTRFDCDYTRGILAGIPTIFGMPIADVEEIECQVAPERYGPRIWPDKPPHGGDGCLYRVTWNPKEKPPIWKRLFNRKRYYHQAIEDLQNANKLIQSKYDEVKQLAHNLEKVNQQLTESKRELESQRSRLIESESRYRLLAENASDIIWILNLETLTFDYISPSVERIRGFTQEEARALNLEQTLSPASFAKVLEILEEESANDAKEGGDRNRFKTLELKHILKNGSYAWAESTASFIRDTEGRPTAVMGVTRDITERKRAEAAISESEKKYRNLFENGSDLLCIHDLEGNILETNLPHKKQYGWRNEDLAGANIRDLIPERHRSGFDRYLERILQNGEDEGYLKGYTKTGDKVVFEYRNRLIYDNTGRPAAVQGAARDVTERIRVQKALKESEEKYRSVLEASPDPIVVCDIEGKVNYFNPAFTRVFGWTLAELSGKKMDILAAGEAQAETQKMIDTVLAGENFSGFETRHRAKGGSIIHVSMSASIYKDQNGRPIGSIINLRDITDQKRIEIQLQQAQKMEAIGTLAGGIAHDFNNLLMGVQGRASLMLMDTDTSPALFEHLKGIEDYVKSAAGLTRQLLGFARGGKYEVKPTNVNELIKKQNHMFGRTRKEIHIHEKLDENIWTADVDQGQIEQVLLNLYVNAWQAMPGGGNLYIQTKNVVIDEEVKRPHSITPGKYIKIIITDTGTGIDEAIQQRIFDPFFTTKGMGRGTGLGLASTYGIIKNHGGHIDFYSMKGDGTTFEIYLPASEKAAAKEETVHEQVLRGTETILFVDDEYIAIDVGQQMLKTLGYTVVLAKSGKEAIEIYEKNRHEIDMVILDMIMPERSGADTYEALKKINPNIKVLLSSGYSINDQATEILDRGCNGFIQKPFNMADLSKKIRDVLDRDSSS